MSLRLVPERNLYSLVNTSLIAMHHLPDFKCTIFLYTTILTVEGKKFSC
jgi:hypothetical protein